LASMILLIICWTVFGTMFALALARAAARPLPRPEEELLSEEVLSGSQALLEPSLADARGESAVGRPGALAATMSA